MSESGCKTSQPQAHYIIIITAKHFPLIAADWIWDVVSSHSVCVFVYDCVFVCVSVCVCVYNTVIYILR